MLMVNSDRCPRRRWGVVVACLLACSLSGLAGCGGSSHKHQTSGASTQPAVSTTTSTPTPSLKPGVGSVDAYLTQNLIHIQLTLFDVRREGPLTTVDFGTACRDARGCDLGFAFQDRAAYEGHGPCTSPRCGNTAGGLLLIDPANNREYGVVRDAQGNPYASTEHSLTQGGQPRLGFAVFPQLPATVRTIDVAFPQGGPVFLNVPVTTGPRTTPATAGTDVQAADGAGAYSGPAENSVAGLTLPVSPLSLTVGSPVGSDREGGRTATFTLRSDVLFAFNKSNLSARAHSILADLAKQIKARAAGTVQVTGYTDSIGSDAVNLPLSRARAAAVVGALRPQAPGVSYTSAGKGSADPVAPNTNKDGSDNPAGRALNRRVTIAVPVRAPAKPAPPPSPAPAAAGSSPSSSPVTYSPGNNSTPYSVAPVALHRDGNLVVLNLSATCNGRCLPEVDFAGTTTTPPLSLASIAGEQAAFLHGVQFTANTPSGVYLTDPRTGDIYPPVTDNAAYPLTSQAGPIAHSGDTLPMWLYFAAPPSGSSVMTVHLPGGSPTMTLPVTGLGGVTVTH